MSLKPVEKNLGNEEQFDQREALFNEGGIGPLEQFHVVTDCITQLRGILFDLDLKLFREGALIPQIDPDPEIFYQTVVQPWLSHHPVLEKAEVRQSGGGLHVILRPDPVIEFANSRECQEWVEIVKVVQAALPIDPQQPGMLAYTRPVGSINAKNNNPVQCLRERQPLAAAEIRGLYEQMREAPFETVFQILTGGKSLAPCPICEQEGSQLDALARQGKCYANCGTVMLSQLYDLVLLPPEAGKAGGAHA